MEIRNEFGIEYSKTVNVRGKQTPPTFSHYRISVYLVENDTGIIFWIVRKEKKTSLKILECQINDIDIYFVKV